MLFDIFSRGKMLAFFVAELDGGDQFGEVLIAVQIHRHKRQKAAVFHRDLGTDDRFYASLFCLEMKPHRTGNRVAVEQGDTGHSKIGRAVYQALCGCEPEERKLKADRV